MRVMPSIGGFSEIIKSLLIKSSHSVPFPVHAQVNHIGNSRFLIIHTRRLCRLTHYILISHMLGFVARKQTTHCQQSPSKLLELQRVFNSTLTHPIKYI
jgi:hypothetical protein